jgi:hypothetical protein
MSGFLSFASPITSPAGLHFKSGVVLGISHPLPQVFPICRARFSAVAEILCPPTSASAAFGAPPMEAGSAEPPAELDGFPACELAKRSANSALSDSRVRKPGSSRRSHSSRHFENSASPALSNRCRTSAPSRTFRLVSLARSCFPARACRALFCASSWAILSEMLLRAMSGSFRKCVDYGNP